MSKESYIRGFCKAAQDNGVDPAKLSKFVNEQNAQKIIDEEARKARSDAVVPGALETAVGAVGTGAGMASSRPIIDRLNTAREKKFYKLVGRIAEKSGRGPNYNYNLAARKMGRPPTFDSGYGWFGKWRNTPIRTTIASKIPALVGLGVTADGIRRAISSGNDAENAKREELTKKLK